MRPTFSFIPVNGKAQILADLQFKLILCPTQTRDPQGWHQHLHDGQAWSVAHDILFAQQLTELDLRSNDFTSEGVEILAPVCHLIVSPLDFGRANELLEIVEIVGNCCCGCLKKMLEKMIHPVIC
jgi:hypothetical protein